MKRTRLLASILALSMLLALLTACGGNNANNSGSSNNGEVDPSLVPGDISEEEKYGGTFVFPISKDPNTLLYAWLISGTTNTISSFLNDKLYLLDEEGNFIPRMCTEYDVSDDGLVYTFKLREGMKWHDGTPVTTEDIVWTNNVTKEPDWFTATGVTGIVDVGIWEAVDELTFTVTIDEPDALFLSTLTDNYIPQPKHYYDGLAYGDYPTSEQAVNPIGCGPFRFVEYKVGDYIMLEAFEDFWGGRPYLDTVYFKITGSSQYTQIAFEAGEVSTMGLTPEYYAEIKDDQRFNFVGGLSENVANLSLSDGRMYQFDENGNKKALYTGDRAIREAMAYMIPYEEICEKILRGNCERSYSMLPMSMQYSTEEGLTKYTYDLDKANQILDDAGYVDTDGDGIRNWKDGSNIVILCSTFTPGSTQERMGILFAEQLAQCGIASGMKTSESTVWAEHFLSGMDTVDLDDVETIIYFWEYCTYSPYLGEVAQCVTTYGEYSNQYIDYTKPGLPLRETIEQEYEPEYLESQKRVDELFEQIKASADEEETMTLWQEAQKILLDDMIVQVNIGTMYSYDAFQKNIHVEDAMWSINSNYTVRMAENIWIEK